jgi:hypothetical protein
MMLQPEGDGSAGAAGPSRAELRANQRSRQSPLPRGAAGPRGAAESLECEAAYGTLAVTGTAIGCPARTVTVVGTDGPNEERRKKNV